MALKCWQDKQTQTEMNHGKTQKPAAIITKAFDAIPTSNMYSALSRAHLLRRLQIRRHIPDRRAIPGFTAADAARFVVRWLAGCDRTRRHADHSEISHMRLDG
jgi:hypothetical protein